MKARESGWWVYGVAFGVGALILGGCASTERSGVGTAAGATGSSPLEVVAEFPHQQVTGVAVSGAGRVFANFPYWADGHTVSVVEVRPDGSQQPYPDTDWNRQTGPAAERFVCVQSVFVDATENLWIVDAGSPKQTGVVDGGAKLVKINLASNRVTQVIPFDRHLAPEKSYLNDVRIDLKNNFAFLTDSNLGAILVVDLANEHAKRVLENDPSVKPEPNLQLNVEGTPLVDPEKQQPLAIASDGIALDPDGRWLYYKALTGRMLYRVPLDDLEASLRSDVDLSDRVERVGQVGASDGLAFHDGRLYVTAIERDAVVRYDPATQQSQVLVRDQRLKWPDSVAFGPDGALYVTTSQIHLTPKFNQGASRVAEPYRVFRIPREDVATGTLAE